MSIKNYKFIWIPTNEVVLEYGISETDLVRFSLDEMLHPRVIGYDDYWNREELDSLVEYLESKIEVLEARDEYLENNAV